MKYYKLADAEEKFAELIWKNEPIGSGDLVKLSEKEMNWKKSTTYTVLKKLCEKGIFQNENAVLWCQSNEDTFGGSLPKFLTAFIGGKKLSDHQAEELKKLIDEYKEV